MNLRTRIVMGVVSALVFVATAQADATLFFGPPDFVWSHPSGGATPNHIWIAGDYWGQDFTGTSQASASHAALRLFIDDNTLLNGDTLNLDFWLNGTNVGSFSVLAGQAGVLDYTFDFPSIAGPNYSVQLLETNTVPPGDGSVSMAANNDSSYLTLTPEPSALALVALLAAGIARRR
jgi:hypothetical protein